MLNNFFISNSFAQTPELANTMAATEFSFSSFVPLVLIFLVFYFLIIRPQSKKMKDHQALTNNLKIGNKVMTNGGILGVVKDIDQKENHVELEISNGVNVKILRNYIAEVMVKEEKSKK